MRIRDLPFLARRNRACAGLYLSASSVALAVATPDGDRVSTRAEALGDANDRARVLADVVRSLGAEGATCVLCAAPESYQLMLVERPSVPEGELRDALRWRIQEYIDFPAADAVVDVFPFPEAASRGRTPMVFVVATPRARLEADVRAANAAGLKPICVDITELSLRNLVHRLYPSAEHAIGLLRVSPANGIVNVTRGDELYLSRRISNVPRSLDDGNWDAFKDTLLLQVQRSIDYYESALSQPAADCLLVASTNGWQSKIVAHLEAMLPLPVRSLAAVLADTVSIELHNPSVRLLAKDSLDSTDEQAVAAALPALGAALRAVNHMETAT